MSQKYDIYLYPGANQPKLWEFFYRQAARVNGATKLTQLFLKALLTPIETKAADGDFAGTELPGLIGSNVVDRDYIRVIITSSVEKALEQVQRRALTVPDATLKTAVVTNIQFDDASNVDVVIELTTTTGQKASVGFPVKTDATTTTNNIAAATQVLGPLLPGF